MPQQLVAARAAATRGAPQAQKEKEEEMAKIEKELGEKAPSRARAFPLGPTRVFFEVCCLKCEA